MVDDFNFISYNKLSNVYLYSIKNKNNRYRYIENMSFLDLDAYIWFIHRKLLTADEIKQTLNYIMNKTSNDTDEPDGMLMYDMINDMTVNYIDVNYYVGVTKNFCSKIILPSKFVYGENIYEAIEGDWTIQGKVIKIVNDEVIITNKTIECIPGGGPHVIMVDNNTYIIDDDGIYRTDDYEEKIEITENEKKQLIKTILRNPDKLI